MQRMINGPKQYLSVGADWTYAVQTETHINAFNATAWIFECAQNAVESGETSWEDLEFAEGFLSTYTLKYKDDETDEVHEREMQVEDITPQGAAILDAAARDEYVGWLFDAWRLELYEEIAPTSRCGSFIEEIPSLRLLRGIKHA